MKILYDFLTLYSKYGSAEYTRRIFFTILNKIKNEAPETILYCLYDRLYMPKYEELLPGILDEPQIQFIDINNGIDKVNELDCNVFFLGCAQTMSRYVELQYINCRSVIVIHDCVWEEFYNNDINIYLTLNSEDIFRHRMTNPMGIRIYFNLKSPTMRFCRWLLHVRQHGILEKGCKMVQPSLNLFRRREDSIIISVSDYSKKTLMYNFNIPETRIKVRFSPERIYKDGVEMCRNEKLQSIIDQRKKFYLLVSANRPFKNAKKTLIAFHRYVSLSPNSYIVTVGYGSNSFENHIDLPFLSDFDLQIAYANCYALIYPSYFEGFGYPPLEAMKYGKPVLSSNVCSMPEILEDAPVYFSPLYESAIFGALCCLTDDNYQYYSEKSITQYSKIHEKQEQDLEDLINIIMSH